MSQVCIDRENMHVLYKHDDQALLVALADLEVPHRECCFLSLTDSHFNQFTDFELRLLYENVCGQKNPGLDRHNLVHAAVQVCLSIAGMDINSIEVNAQRNEVIGKADGCYYKYVKGSVHASKQLDLYQPNALVSVVGYVPSATMPTQGRTAPAAHTQAAGTINVSAPRAPSVPRTPSASGDAPKGGVTARVWAIADEVLAKYPERPIDFKKISKEVGEICESEGINGSTKSVQYSKWRQTKS